MIQDEKIFQDEKRWLLYPDSEDGDICVYCRCPECGKFIKKGELFTNKGGEAQFKNWICKKHGEVTPFYVRD